MPIAERPRPFGYKMIWYAVSAADPSAVADAIGLRNVAHASWTDGIEAAYSDGVFVSPPVRGWILVASISFPDTFGEPDWAFPRLLTLSSRFGDAQAFCTHRVVDLHVWARAKSGTLLRAYGYLGESGETLVQIGPQTPEELQLGFRFYDERSAEAADSDYPDNTDLSFPDETSVMSLARLWSIAPVDLGPDSGEPALGLVGKLRR